MDKVTQYRKIVREVLTPIAQRRYSSPTISHEAVFDDANDRYLIMSVGWEGRAQRIHHCLLILMPQKQSFGSVRVCSRQLYIHVFVFEPRRISGAQATARSQEGIAQDTEHPCADIRAFLKRFESS